MKSLFIIIFLMTFSSYSSACKMTELAAQKNVITTVITSLEMMSSKKVEAINRIHFISSTRVEVKYTYTDGNGSKPLSATNVFNIKITPDCRFLIQ